MNSTTKKSSVTCHWLDRDQGGGEEFSLNYIITWRSTLRIVITYWIWTSPLCLTCFLTSVLRYIKKHTECPGTSKPYPSQWILCEPKEKWGSDCQAISVGIGTDWSFEEAIVKEGCEVWAFDHTIKYVPTHFQPSS